MAAEKCEVSSEEEILLTVPEELALVPLGFSVDAGGSVTKLVYRSKEDYKNGIRIRNTESSDGLLRMRYFRRGADEELINFIADRCDIMESVDEADAWVQTGAQIGRFKERLEEFSKTKLKAVSALDAVYKAFRGFYSGVASCRPLRLSPAAVDQALQTIRGFMQMMRASMELGDGTFGGMESKVDPEVAAAWAMKLMTSDGEALAEEISQYEIVWPCLSVTCGSSDAMIIITEEGKYDLSFNSICGKTFVSLGKSLCGTEDFDELIELASRGDHRKVDTMSGDMKVKNRKDVDWYSVMPESHVIFTLGKLAEDSYKDAYTKADLAAGMLHMIASIIAKVASSTARLTKAKCVVISGSFVNHQVARDALQEWLLQESLLQPFFGEEQIKWVFLPYPGFTCALGAWYRNWELDQERRKK